MLFWTACLIGATMFVYTGWQPAVLGFPFPNLQGEWVVRPTLMRLSLFFIGRWLAYLFLGLLFSSLGAWLSFPVLPRLVYANTFLFSVFMLLYLVTRHSPEIRLAKWTDPSGWPGSIFVLGGLSGFTFCAPLLVACCWAMLQPTRMQGMLFFTNVFLGNAIFSLPILLNMRWAKTAIYQGFLKMTLFFCSLIVLILSILSFIKS